jgi:hypothetical protein
MAASPIAVGIPGMRRWLVAGAVLVAAVMAVLATRSGPLGHRSVADLAYELPIGQDTDCVRIEIQNGTVGVAIGSGAVVSIGGGVRRAADTPEELATLEGLPTRLEVVPDPDRPRTMRLRGPELPAGHTGLFGFELGIRLPAELPVEVVVAGSGHVTVADRTGRIEVRTGRGDIRFERCQAAIRAETGRGNVIAFDHRGDLQLTTVVGDMQAFVVEAGRELSLSTGQGTVQCSVPAGLEFDLDARAEVGRIGSDFDLTAERVGDFGAALVARRGAAATRVVLRTGKGHLAFRAK